ncbi:MAG: hypothetical protein E7603_00880 [Ruminococcaceae bacterium]|nr:hypothetical protein [Oscillospiraceae bacterium]
MEKYFAAANTEAGFFSLFDEVFSSQRLRRIYILKGGPGTGKSTLMKNIGFMAENRGFEVEYICCSSDPHSLDGIIIPSLSVAVLDGTAPHITDPVYPGVTEHTVNLEEALDCEALTKKREEIISLIRSKKEAYRTAYRFLSAAGILEKERDALTETFFLREKAEAAVKRLLDSFRHIEKGEQKHRYISAISCDGVQRLDTLRRHAKKFFAVTDKYGFGRYFMNTLYEAVCTEKLAATVCSSPLNFAHKEAIFLEGENVLFMLADEKEAENADKIINCMRFIRKEAVSERKGRLRFFGKCEEAILEGALSALAEAGKFHKKAEKIYSACVDFSEIDAIKMKMISEIFANNM